MGREDVRDVRDVKYLAFRFLNVVDEDHLGKHFFALPPRLYFSSLVCLGRFLLLLCRFVKTTSGIVGCVHFACVCLLCVFIVSILLKSVTYRKQKFYRADYFRLRPLLSIFLRSTVKLVKHNDEQMGNENFHPMHKYLVA